jgi:hypothetical protein
MFSLPKKYKSNVIYRGTMRKSLVLSIAVLCGLMNIHAETHISGDIRTATLDATGNPYIVDQDVVVPAGKRLTIKEGCILLFKGFTGINVFGQLTVAGSAKQPVVFTSINDGDYNSKSEQLPNPFDWNGILIARESAGAALQNFQLRYSVYGVKSQNTNVTIQSGVFRQNGQFHFTINDKIQYVQDNISFSYTGGETGTAASSTSTKESESGSSSSSTSSGAKKPTSNSKLIIRYSSLGVGVIGIIVGSVFVAQYASSFNDLNNWDKNHSDLSASKPAYDATLSKNHSQLAGTLVGYGLGLLGLAGFTLTFVF